MGAKIRKNPRKCRRCHQTVTAPEEIRPGGLVCLECQRKRNRKRSRKFYEEHAEEVIARSSQWKRDHPEKVREYRAAYMERVKADPEWETRYYEGRRQAWRDYYERLHEDPEKRERRLELQREAHRARRLERGLPVRPITQAEYYAKFGNGYGQATRVSTAPLLPFLEVVKRHGDVESLAAAARVSPKLIHGVLEESRDPIALVTADRLCAALDLPMALVYGEIA